MSRGAVQAPAAPIVSEREIQAGMVSYAVECFAAIALAFLIVLSKVTG